MEFQRLTRCISLSLSIISFIHTTLDESSPLSGEPVERGPLLARISASKAQAGDNSSSPLSRSSAHSIENSSGSILIGIGRGDLSSSSSGSAFGGGSVAVSSSPSPSPISRQHSYSNLGASASIYSPRSSISPTATAPSFNSPEQRGFWPSSFGSIGSGSLQSALSANERLQSGLGLQLSPVQSDGRQHDLFGNSSHARRELKSIFDDFHLSSREQIGDARTVGFKPEGARHQSSNSTPSFGESFSSQEELRGNYLQQQAVTGRTSLESFRDRQKPQPTTLGGFGFSPFQPYAPQTSQARQPQESQARQPHQAQARPPGFFLPQAQASSPLAIGNGSNRFGLEPAFGEDKPQQRLRSFTLPSLAGQEPSSIAQTASLWRTPQAPGPQSYHQQQAQIQGGASYAPKVGSLWEMPSLAGQPRTPLESGSAPRGFFDEEVPAGGLNFSQGSTSPSDKRDYDLTNDETFGWEQSQKGSFQNGMFLN